MGKRLEANTARYWSGKHSFKSDIKSTLKIACKGSCIEYNRNEHSMMRVEIHSFRSDIPKKKSALNIMVNSCKILHVKDVWTGAKGLGKIYKLT